MTFEKFIENQSEFGGITLQDLEDAMYNYIEHEFIEEGDDRYNELQIGLARLRMLYASNGADYMSNKDLYALIEDLPGDSRNAMYTITLEAVNRKVQEAADASNGMPLDFFRRKEEGSEADAETEAETEENFGVGKIVLIVLAIVLFFLIMRR